MKTENEQCCPKYGKILGKILLATGSVCIIIGLINLFGGENDGLTALAVGVVNVSIAIMFLCQSKSQVKIETP